MQDLKGLYEARATQFFSEADRLGQQYIRLSILRLVGFVIGIGAIIYLWTSFGWVPGALAILFGIVAFGFFVVRHEQIKEAQLHHQQLGLLNEQEADAINGRFHHFENGADFIHPQHPYGVDLDIFGDYSLFQFLNRTTTVLGRERLAEFLAAPTDQKTIVERQKAVRELTPQLDWRQALQAYGRATAEEKAYLAQLKQWLEAPTLVQGNRLYQIAMYLAPLPGIGGIVLGALYFPAIWPYLLWVPAILVLQQTVKKVNEIHRQTGQAAQILKNYARLIFWLEQPAFQSPLLQQLQTRLKSQDRSASQHLNRLAYLISQLNVRYNFFAVFLNLWGLWDLHWVYRLERWRNAQARQLPEWFATLAELEALSSLANLAHNRPDWTFPEINPLAPIEMQQAGHPLLLPQKRVDNDLLMPASAHIKLITGSNMAGKSTFLRTVGVNMILAMAGSVVCAKVLRMPLLKVYTSMRTQDALQESTSSFFAELKRLKTVIKAVESKEQVFFLLDEILKGTNSRDRHTGAKALIWQLIRNGGAGLIATHDLELASLEAQSKGAVENLCMEVAIQNGKLHFDYQLKKGVTESFNASILMQQMGIDLHNEETT